MSCQRAAQPVGLRAYSLSAISTAAQHKVDARTPHAACKVRGTLSTKSACVHQSTGGGASYIASSASWNAAQSLAGICSRADRCLHSACMI
jgi:hypothetical protein